MFSLVPASSEGRWVDTVRPVTIILCNFENNIDGRMALVLCNHVLPPVVKLLLDICHFIFKFRVINVV